MTARARVLRLTAVLLASALAISGVLSTAAASEAVSPEEPVVSQQDAVEVPVAEPTAKTDVAPETGAESGSGSATVTEASPAPLEAPNEVEKRVSTFEVPNLSPCVAGVGPENATGFTEATLDWGVKESYRSYLVSPISQGKSEPLGATTGQFAWAGGAGSLTATGSAGAFGFGRGNGVHFFGHAMEGGYALDQTFTNPCIEIVSDSRANLYLDVNSRMFKSMTELSQDWFEQNGVLFATIDLQSDPEVRNGTTTWRGAPAKLTEAGSIAFGGFYPAHGDLDPLTFSVPFEISPPTSTSVQLKSSASKIVEKTAVVLTAVTRPADIPGTVTFSSGGTDLGAAVRTAGGEATLTTKTLPPGTNEVRALFTPDASGDYASSRSNVVEITVAEAPSPSMADGGLEWGVKKSFRSYVVGPIAQGKISVQQPASQNQARTSYKYPQAAGGTWNGVTGTVQYAGNVNFYGHDGAMNIDLANPVISVKSNTKAELVVKHKKKEMVLATIDLGSAKRTLLQGGAVSFVGAKTRLSEVGADEYFAYEGPEGIDGFYSPGDELDALTFTIGKSTETKVVDPITKTLKKAKRPVVKPLNSGTSGDSQAAGSLLWGVSTAFAEYVTGPISKGSVATSGVGSSGGAYLFPQAVGGSWNTATQTGTVQYSGVISFTGHKGLLHEGVSNPMIEVTNGATGAIYSGGTRWGTLDLAAASKSVGANGEVTWSGVPVSGGFSGGASGSSQYSLAADPLTFTVGAASGVSYGSTKAGRTAKAKRTPAAFAPAATGIDVLTDATKLKPGGRIELEARGFELDDEGVLVVLYGAGGSKPIVLDEEASANNSGVVGWSGTLPKDIKGKYTITLQGSINAGAIIDVREVLDAKQGRGQSDRNVAQLDDRTVRTSGFVGSAPSNGMSTWEWWASAGGLVVIAACTTLLAVRQRRVSR